MTDLTWLRSELRACFDTALAAVRPGAALAGALDTKSDSIGAPYLLAVGKAAVPMARAAVAWLGARDVKPVSGLVVAPESDTISGISVIAGDHPLPDQASAAAAHAIAGFCSAVPPDATIWFLLSGGATSLIAGPEAGLSIEDLRRSYDQLLRSGLDIRAMNLVRKRLSRWGGGKLAVALAPAKVEQYIISDVVGDTLDAIGSGPAVPDTGTAGEALAVIDQAGIRHLMPPPALERLEAMADGSLPDLPAAGGAAFAGVTTTIVASNRVALQAASDFAGSRGWTVDLEPVPITGEAAEAGRILARRILAQPGRRLLVAGGETTVRLSPDTTGQGGRCQELALAAAELLGESKRTVALLAVGSDGRDGPTDAAGGLVDAQTWQRIGAGGMDPGALLEKHDAYRALAASGDLLRIGATGTNVMDLVIGAISD